MGGSKERQRTVHFCAIHSCNLTHGAWGLQGGKWILTIKPAQRGGIDRYWENLVLAMIGETLDPGDEVAVLIKYKQALEI